MLDVQAILQRFHSNLDIGLSHEEAKRRLKRYGRNAPKKKGRSWLEMLKEAFWSPIPCLLEISIVLALIMRREAEALVMIALLIFVSLVRFFEMVKVQRVEEKRGKRGISSVNVLREGHWSKIPSIDLALGDVVSIKKGDVIPADLLLTKGKFLAVDQSFLTGEIDVKEKKVGEEVVSGSLVMLGEMVGIVTATGSNAFKNKRGAQFGEKEEKSPFQKSVEPIVAFFAIFSALVFLICAITSLFRIEVEANVHESFTDYALYLLMILVTTLPFMIESRLVALQAIGAKKLAKIGVVVEHLQKIEELGRVDTLLVHKNGMLTQNEPKIAYIIAFKGNSQREVLLSAYLASTDSEDPIDRAIFEEFGKKLGRHATEGEYKEIQAIPFDSTKKYAESRFEKGISAVKGAPKAIAALTQTPYEEIEKLVKGYAGRGMHVLGVARSGAFIGLIVLEDALREGVKEEMAALMQQDLDVKIISGDDVEITQQTSKALGLGEFIQRGNSLSFERGRLSPMLAKSDGFAEVQPQQKESIVKGLREAGSVVAMVGEDVSEIPALRAANISIGDASASYAVQQSVDMVLQKNGPSLILPAIQKGRSVGLKIRRFLFAQIAVTTMLLLFLVISTFVVENEPLTPIMIALIALFNGISILGGVSGKGKIEKGESLLKVVFQALFLAFIWVIAIFGLHWIGIKMWYMAPPALHTLSFLSLAIGGIVALLAPYLKEKTLPSFRLGIAFLVNGGIASFLAAFGLPTPNFEGVGVEKVGLSLAYLLVWCFLSHLLLVIVQKNDFSLSKKDLD